MEVPTPKREAATPEVAVVHSVIAVAVLASHRLLDIVDGGIVPLPFPFVEAGTEPVYPATVTAGQEPVGVVDGSLVVLRRVAPRAGYLSFGVLGGFVAASTLAFRSVWVGRRFDGGRAVAADGSGAVGGDAVGGADGDGGNGK
jgi:hypothetical protein